MLTAAHAEPPPSSSPPSLPPTERIYVGGLDPQRLSVQQVADRLGCLVEVTSIETTDRQHVADDCFVGTGQTFFYVNARANNSTDGVNEKGTHVATSTALQILSKNYNNVKWKGCTIRVEAARPHFLDRLKMEREEREREEEKRRLALETQQKEALEQKETINTNTLGSVARNLRIRRRHGEEAFRVDTKPIDVGATDFTEALDKLRRKRAKHAFQYAEQKRRLKRQAKGRGPKDGASNGDLVEDVGSPNGKVYLNRGVHVRFVEENDNDNENTFVNATTSSNEPRDDHIVQNGSNSSNSSNEGEGENIEEQDTTDDSSVDDTSMKHGPDRNDSYAWSDEEEDIDKKGESSDIVDKDSTDADDTDNTDDAYDAYDVSSGKKKVEEEEEDEDEEEEGPSGGYAWSNDDSDSDDDSDSNDHDLSLRLSSYKAETTRDGCKECSTPADYDEFSSAMVFSSGNGDNVKDDDFAGDEEEEVTSVVSASEIQLDQDVSSNLNVLGQLFPEMAKIKPNKPTLATGRGDDGLGEASAPLSRPGWGSIGLMQRYDPNDVKSAKLFEVKSSDNTEVEMSTTLEQYENRSSTSSKDGTEDFSDESSEDESTGKDQSKTYERDDGTDDESTSASSDVCEDEREDEDEAKEEKDEEQKIAYDRTSIYEQGKLENIFQEARSGAGGSSGFQMSQLFGGQLNSAGASPDHKEVSSEKPSSFSFGFDVGESSAVEPNQVDGRNTTHTVEKPSSGFNFGFDVPSIADKDSGATSRTDGQHLIVSTGRKTDEDTCITHPARPIGSSTGNKEQNTLKRRRGILFPKTVLDSLEESFFHLNEGGRVLDDYTSMKDDRESQAAWNEERKTLTIDWKRKLKYAQSRKRMRRK